MMAFRFTTTSRLFGFFGFYAFFVFFVFVVFSLATAPPARAEILIETEVRPKVKIETKTKTKTETETDQETQTRADNGSGNAHGGASDKNGKDPLQEQEGREKQELFGLAMHGAPKYGPDAAHLGYANPGAPKGGTLRQAVIGRFDNLNPQNIKGQAAEGLGLVNDRLMGRVWDEPFTLYPLIAQKIEVPEDRSALTVHIDPRARFHDGSPILAEDVLFSYHTLKKHGRPNARRIYELATGAEAKGKRTVEFRFGPGYDRETVMIFAMMPVLSKKWWSGRDFNATILEIPLGNGPYRIADIDPGRWIIYERVKDYWAGDLFQNRGHYNFDRVINDYFRDDHIAFEAFKKGDLNYRREHDGGRWKTAYDDPADGFRHEELKHGRPDRINGFIFNTRRAPFDDIRVRRALSLVFDFDWMNENLFYGQYRRINSFFPNTDLGGQNPPLPDNSTPEKQRENMRRADALLQEAGWSVQNGKRIHDRTGEQMHFIMLLGAPGHEKIAMAFIRSLKKLGIDARAQAIDRVRFLNRLGPYDFDMILHYWISTLSPGTEQYLFWSCESANTPNRWNFAGICDPEIDRVAKAVAHARTREELRSLSAELDQRLMEGHYMVPLHYGALDYVAYWPPMRRPEKVPLYGPVLESWWIDPE